MNKTKSVQARLLNLSKKQRTDYNYLLIRYGIERLIYRLMHTQYKDRFVLKGAMLFLIWHEDTYRPTKDLDFLGTGIIDENELLKIFKDIFAVEVPDDGIKFDPDHINIEEIRDGEIYHGYRINVRALLGTAKIGLQVDIGLGDAIFPTPTEQEFPSLLDSQGLIVKAYPKEAMLAEKFDAILALGLRNSRMKDYFDIYILVRDYDFDGKVLVQAIAATVLRRGRTLPSDVPTGFQEEFSNNPDKNKQWDAFLRRIGTKQVNTSLQETILFLRSFFEPIIHAWSKTAQFDAIWIAGGPWKERI